MSLKDRINRAPVGMVSIDAVKVGVRRREKTLYLASLGKSLEEHGLIHPIVVNDDGSLIAGCRRLAAAQRIGWKKIKAVRVKVTQKELRELESAENKNRVDLDNTEASAIRTKAMAKEVAQLTIEKAKAEELAIQRGESRSRKSAKTKKRETEKQARENLGISHQVSSRDERTMAAVDRFPLLESWGQRTVLRAAEGIGNLPKNEHKGAEYLLGTFERGEQVIACEALENMIDHLEPDLRKEIYKRARSGDPDQVLRAQTTAAALYPVPDSWFGSLAIALKELKRVVKGRKKQDFAQGRIRAAYQELDRAVSFMNDEYKEVRAEVLAELKGKAR